MEPVALARSNRETRLIWCLWLSLSGFDGQFEQRNLLDMVLVAVPSGLRWAMPIYWCKLIEPKAQPLGIMLVTTTKHNTEEEDQWLNSILH